MYKTTNKSKAILALAVIVVFLNSSEIWSQKQSQSLISIKPRGCEFNNLALEQANAEVEEDSVIILISRLGISDKKTIAQQRLYTAKAYLTEYYKNQKSDKVIIAEARQNNKFFYGGIEIYIKGKLFDTLTSDPNSDLLLGSCLYQDAEDNESKIKSQILYPWRYGKKWYLQ